MNEFLSHFNDLEFGKAVLKKMLKDRHVIRTSRIFKKLFYLVIVINIILLMILFTVSTNKAIDNCVKGGTSRDICERDLR